MEKNTKNIILIAIILVMMICSYFTIKQLNFKSIPDINFNQNEIFNNKKDLKELPDNTITDKETKEDNDSTNKNGMNNRPSRPNGSNSRNNNNYNKINPNKSNSLLYIILFGLEYCVIGGSIVYLFLLNTNKLKEAKKKEK